MNFLPWVLALAVLVPPALAVPGVTDLPSLKLPLPPPGAVQCGTGVSTATPVFAEDFEDGLAGWSLITTAGRPNLWHGTSFRGNNSDMDDLGHEGPGRAYYGIENAQGGTYNTHSRNQGELRSAPVTVPVGGGVIAFNTKWHVEWDRAWIIDSMMVGYINPGGQRVFLCWVGNTYAGVSNLVMGYGYYQNSPTGQLVPTGCEYALESPQNPCRFADDFLNQDITFDLAPRITLWEPRLAAVPPTLGGQTIQLVFYYQTGDAIVDDAMGWMIDDVRLTGLA